MIVKILNNIAHSFCWRENLDDDIDQIILYAMKSEYRIKDKTEYQVSIMYKIKQQYVIIR